MSSNFDLWDSIVSNLIRLIFFEGLHHIQISLSEAYVGFRSTFTNACSFPTQQQQKETIFHKVKFKDFLLFNKRMSYTIFLARVC